MMGDDTNFISESAEYYYHKHYLNDDEYSMDFSPQDDPVEEPAATGDIGAYDSFVHENTVWTQAVSPEGYPYFINTETGESQVERLDCMTTGWLEGFL